MSQLTVAGKKEIKREKSKEKYFSEAGEQVWLGDKGFERKKLVRV